MKGKRARQLRKLLSLKNKEVMPTEMVSTGKRLVGVIDGIGGNHRIEEREKFELTADDTKQMYRKLKKAYTEKGNMIYKQLVKDISLIN